MKENVFVPSWKQELIMENFNYNNIKFDDSNSNFNKHRRWIFWAF